MSKPKTTTEIFAKNVRRLMADKEWTQPQVAEAARKVGYSINQTTIGRALKNSNPTIESMEAIAAALSVPAWQLLMPENVRNFPKAEKAGALIELVAGLNDAGVSAATAMIKGLAERPEFQITASKAKQP